MLSYTFFYLLIQRSTHIKPVNYKAGNSFMWWLFLSCFALLLKNGEKEETEWYLSVFLQIPAKAGAGPIQSQNLGIQSGSLILGVGIQPLKPSPVASQSAHSGKLESEVEIGSLSTPA